MLPMFKRYCKDMTIGSLIGASIGGASGAVAGKIGINQLCNIPGVSQDSCSFLVSKATPDAVQRGSAVGAAVGFGIGLFLYPLYKGIKRAWLGENAPSPSQDITSERNDWGQLN